MGCGIPEGKHEAGSRGTVRVSRGERQPGGDLLVAQPLAHQGQHLPLALGDDVEPALVTAGGTLPVGGER